MLNVIPFDGLSIVWGMVIAGILFILALIIFSCIWVKNNSLKFVKGHYTFPNLYYDDEISRTQNFDVSSNIVATSSLKSYFRVMLTILCKLDEEYWLDNVGFEAYSYAFLLLKMSRVCALYGLFYGLFYFLIYLMIYFQEGSDMKMEIKLLTQKYHPLNALFSATNMLVITVLTIFMIVDTRRTLSHQYYLHMTKKPNTLKNALNWLQLRTIEVENTRKIFDMNPRTLTGFVKQNLTKLNVNSRIYSTIIVPDMAALTKLEVKKRSLQDLKTILDGHSPLFSCLVPRELKDDILYAKKIKTIEYEIDQDIGRQYLGSKIAFMSLQSLESISKVKNQMTGGLSFRQIGRRLGRHLLKLVRPFLVRTHTFGATQGYYSALGSNTESYNSFSNRQQTAYTQGGFMDYLNEESFELNNNWKEFALKVTTFVHPNDIAWSNLTVQEDFHKFTRVLLLILTVLLLLFISTPTAFANFLPGSHRVEQVLFLSWLTSEESRFKDIIGTSLSAFILSIINHILLRIIVILSRSL